MLNKQDAIRIFSKRGITLKTASPTAVDHLAIPETSKQFLKEIGLPPEADLLLIFDFDPDYLPTLAEYAKQKNIAFATDMSTFRRIGTADHFAEFCIDEARGGEFVHIDNEKGTKLFVNSSIEKFGECLAIYYKYTGTAKGMTDAEAKEIAIREEKEMRDADPRAFENTEYYWALLCEEMKYGMI